jgi:hypothetical protein
MKGKTLERKIVMLHEYWLLGSHTHSPNGWLSCKVCLRVDNYIKALCRGGQLRAKESLKTFQENDWYEEYTKK